MARRLWVICRMIAALAIAYAALQMADLLGALREETQARQRVMVALPQLLERQVGALRADLLRESTATRAAAVAEIRALTATADARLAAIQADADRHASVVTASTVQLLARYERVPGEMAWATSTIWDCESNPDCLENRYVSVSRAVESSARAIQSGVPRIVQSTERVSESVAQSMPQLVESSAGVAANLNRITKPRWYDRLLNGAITAGMLLIK